MTEKEKAPRPQRHMAIPLAALHAVEATSAYFTEQPAEREPLSEVEIAPAERTPEGFIELGWEHLEAQKSLHHDLWYVCDGPFDTWPKVMQARAQAAVEKFNTGRREPIDIATVDTKFLFRLAEPRWAEETADTWPEDFQADLEMLGELDAKLRVLSQDEKLQAGAREIWQERTEIMKQAAAILSRERKITLIAQKIADIRTHGAAVGRQPLSKGKRSRIKSLETQLSELQETLYANELPEQLLPDLAEEIERRTRKDLRRQFESGLVMTKPMEALIHEALPSIGAGNPALFLGETGGAKTALAEYIARKLMRKEPEIVSGYADVNGYQLMGKAGLTTKEGATVSEFIAGPVVRAIKEGRPLILDEINAMPPEFLKRLNIITQLRPGDTFSIQEDSGKVITVKQGFCIMATANEKSRRYQGVHDLSTEFRNRFVANTYPVGYPDAKVVVGQEPLDNYKLAYAAVSDRAGNVLFEEGTEKLEAFAKAAHITQRLFSGYVSEGLPDELRDVVGSARLADTNATGLDENVLAPRTMAALLEKVVDSQGALSLERVLKRWVDSIKSPHDKQVITTILTSRHLLGITEEEGGV